MYILNTYIDSILSAIYAVGATAIFGQEMPVSSDASALIPSNSTIKTVELTIPVAINGLICNPDHGSTMQIGAWLAQHTELEIAQFILLSQLPHAAHVRLQKVIADRSQKVQALVSQEGIAVDQVILDFVQDVLAVAWDAYEQLPKKERAQGLQNLQQSDGKTKSFEQLTELLVTRLRSQFKVARTDVPQEVQVTIETQKLAEFPAHALTYIKLLISGGEKEPLLFQPVGNG